MDLAEAQRVAKRPHHFDMPEWERALRILMRWASEPCTDKQYEKRLDQCRSVLAYIDDANIKAARRAAFRAEQRAEYEKALRRTARRLANKRLRKVVIKLKMKLRKAKRR